MLLRRMAIAGFDPNSRASYDTLVANNVRVTATDSWNYGSVYA